MKKRGLIFLLPILTALVGCQSALTQAPMSLEEAKSVSLETQRGGLVMPARSINDLRAQLYPLKPRDADCELFWELVNYKTDKRWDDFAAAKDRSDKWRTGSRLFDSLENLLFYGDYEAVMALAKRSLDKVNRVRWYASHQAVFATHLVRMHAVKGDAAHAEQANQAVRQAWNRINSSGNSSRATDRIKFEIVSNLSRAAIFKASGDLTNAVRHYRLSLADYKEAAGINTVLRKIDQILVATDLSDTLVQTGNATEAELIARDAFNRASSFYTLFDTANMDARTAVTLTTLAKALYEQNRFADAAEIGRAAVHFHKNGCSLAHSLPHVAARVTAAKAYAATDRWAEVEAIYDGLEQDLANLPDYRARLFADAHERTMAELKTGDADKAAEIAADVLSQTRDVYGADSPQALEALGYRGLATDSLADLQEAVTGLTALQLGGFPGVDRATRDLRFRHIVEGYLGLLTETDRDGARDEGFALVQLLAGQGVHRALASSGVRIAVNEPELADLVRRQQDARQAIDSFSAMLATQISAPSAKQDRELIESLRGRVADLRRADTTLLGEIERRFPKYQELTRTTAKGAEAVAAVLDPDERLIQIHVGEEKTFAWVVGPKGITGFHVLARGRDALAAQTDELLGALNPEARLVREVPSFDTAVAFDLYQQLIEPLKPALGRSRALMIATSAPLSRLPLDVLLTRAVEPPASETLAFEGYRGLPWLARDYAITVVPTVSSFLSLRQRPPVDVDRRPFAGFGDPVFGGKAVRDGTRGGGIVLARRAPVKTRASASATLTALPRLPDTADEIEAVARVLGADPETDVYLGARASEATVKTMDLSDRAVLSFATHGLVPGDLDGLTQPALALSKTEGADDGLLTMEEISALRLNADWVVLSACNTAAGEGAGAEAVTGLGKAFFYAGARGLLVSHWPVHSRSTRLLMEDLFARYAEDTPRSEARRAAQLALADTGIHTENGRPAFAYAHPMFWAPFSLVGDGGGIQP